MHKSRPSYWCSSAKEADTKNNLSHLEYLNAQFRKTVLPGYQQPSQALLLLAWIPGIPFHNYLKTGHSVKLCIYISQNCIVGVCGFWKDHMLKFLYCWSYTMHASNLYQTFCSCDIFLTLYVQSAKADWRSPRKSEPHSSHHINQTICNVYTITQCWSLLL